MTATSHHVGAGATRCTVPGEASRQKVEGFARFGVAKVYLYTTLSAEMNRSRSLLPKGSCLWPEPSRTLAVLEVTITLSMRHRAERINSSATTTLKGPRSLPS